MGGPVVPTASSMLPKMPPDPIAWPVLSPLRGDIGTQATARYFTRVKVGVTRREVTLSAVSPHLGQNGLTSNSERSEDGDVVTAAGRHQKRGISLGVFSRLAPPNITATRRA